MILLAYIKANKKSILYGIGILTIFLTLFVLSELLLGAYIYGAVLSGTVGILYGVYDYYKFYRKHQSLQHNVQSIVNGLSQLPEQDNLIEEDYHELLRVLHEEMTRAISKLDQSNSERIDYFTLWVHQIKTPISAMSLLLQQEEQVSPQLKDELFKIERYVEMVLQYLRMESISSDLKIQKLSLDHMVKQAVKKYAPLFIRRKIGVTLSELDHLVITDEKWFVFVIEQLLSNAIKYSNEGNILIYWEEPGYLVIEDQGIGIDEEDLPRVFEKGFTGYNGRMNRQSTGIGLYLCQKICKTLSHQIQISSKVKAGTKVKIDMTIIDLVIE